MNIKIENLNETNLKLHNYNQKLRTYNKLLMAKMKIK